MKLLKITNIGVNGLASIMLLLMAFIPCIEFTGRHLFKAGITGAPDYIQHLTLWVGLIGAVLAARENKHLRIVGALGWLPEPFRIFADYWANFLAAMICWSLCGASLQFIMAEAPALPENICRHLPSFFLNWLEPFGHFTGGSSVKIGGLIPQWIAESIMPVGFFAMALCFIVCFTRKGIWKKLIIAMSLPLVIVLAAVFPSAPSNFAWIGIVILAFSAVLGIPIFVFIGGIALLLFWSEGVTTSAIPVEMYRIVVSPVFPTIPLFTLAGFLLSESKASERFAAVFQSLFSWIPGGTAVAVTILCAFFTTFTGASGITILALGGILLPVLLSNGSSERFSIGLLTATGSIGLLFPPSLVVILYATIAKVSIVDMFKAGLLPGIVLVTLICIICVWQGMKGQGNRNTFNLRNAANAVWKAKWELLIPVVAMIAIFGGFCTIVEAAAATVVYTLIIEVFVYRDLDAAKLYALLVKCAILVGGVLIVIGVAMGLTSYLVDAQIPMQTADWVIRHSWPRWEFLLALNIGLLLVGCLMDIYSALIIVVPLILPIAAVFGVDPIHLGIIFLVNLELGYLHPPVGMNLFLSAFRFNKTLMRVALYALPFLVIFIFVVILVTYVPWLSLGFLNLLK